MPKVKQKYAEPTHVPISGEHGALTVCEEYLTQWERYIAASDCPACMELLTKLGRMAEDRFYELP